MFHTYMDEIRKMRKHSSYFHPILNIFPFKSSDPTILEQMVYISRGHAYMYIPMSYTMCSICIRSTKNSKFEASKKFIKSTFLCHGPLQFLPDHLSCLSKRKTRWTMSGHLLGFKNYILGTSTSMVPLPFFL